jgi:hypothetical protein
LTGDGLRAELVSEVRLARAPRRTVRWLAMVIPFVE